MKYPIFIAELSCNHLGSFDRAMKTIEAARHSGADAVKLQTFTPDGMVCDRNYVIRSGTWAGKNLYELYAEAHTPRDWHKPLLDYIRGLGMMPVSTPFDVSDVDFLETMNCDAYKIASFELTDLRLIRRVAETKKPIIISTGMGNKLEIFEAVHTARGMKNDNITLLKCTSAYPAFPSEANIAAMVDNGHHYAVNFGLSDHSMSFGPAVAAAVLGASMIEKHFTLDRTMGGPDSSFSLEPYEFQAMVGACKSALDSIGSISYEISVSEKENLQFRRSLFAARDIEIGELFSEDNIISRRPLIGIPANRYYEIIGKIASKRIEKHKPIFDECIEYPHRGIA